MFIKADMVEIDGHLASKSVVTLDHTMIHSKQPYRRVKVPKWLKVTR